MGCEDGRATATAASVARLFTTAEAELPIGAAIIRVLGVVSPRLVCGRNCCGAVDEKTLEPKAAIGHCLRASG
jgi:hypothetical protein